MMKIVVLLVVWILAPPFIWVALGSQLIYASRLTRRERLTARTQRLIHSHAQITTSSALS